MAGLSITLQMNGILRIYDRHTGRLIKEAKPELWTKTKNFLESKCFSRSLAQQMVWKKTEECYVLYNLNAPEYWLKISGRDYETVEVPVSKENNEITVFLDYKEKIPIFWGKQWITGEFSKNKKGKQSYYFSIHPAAEKKRVLKIASAGTYRIRLPWFETEAVFGRRLYLQGCPQLYQLNDYDFTSGEYQLTSPLLQEVRPGQTAELLRAGKPTGSGKFCFLIDQEMQKKAMETEVILVSENGEIKNGLLTEFIREEVVWQ